MTTTYKKAGYRSHGVYRSTICMITDSAQMVNWSHTEIACYSGLDVYSGETQVQLYLAMNTMILGQLLSIRQGCHDVERAI